MKIRKDKKLNRIGETFTNKHGSTYRIIEYNNTTDIVVEFIDEYKHRVHTNYYCAEHGKVANPFNRTVYGVGIVGNASCKDNKREYKLWQDMLRRCYARDDGAYQEETNVCERWHIFHNFLEDLPKIEGYGLWKSNPNQRIALDKDIRGNGARLYSLDNCCFVTDVENTKEKNTRKPPKTRPIIGVNIETGEIIRFDTTSLLTKHGFTRSSVMNVCNGKSKQHRGYKWYWEE